MSIVHPEDGDNWREVNRENLCPICGKSDWCGRNGDVIRCMRVADAPSGYRVVKRNSDGGTVFAPENAPSAPAQRTRPCKNKTGGRAKTYPTIEALLAALQYTPELRGARPTIHRYTDMFAVIRFDSSRGKSFRPIHHDGSGWRIGDPPGLLPLYRFTDIQGIRVVWVVEGEKCAEALRSIGLLAITSAHGAKAANRSDWSGLAGLLVIVIPDRDPPGRGYALDVARIVARLTPPARVKILEPNWIPDGGDIADVIAAVGENQDPTDIARDLEQLAVRMPFCTPTEGESVDDDGSARPRLIRLSDVKPEPLRWLWPNRIPLGKLTLIGGDPGLGKSCVTIDIAARVSTGTSWPDRRDEENPIGGVVLLSAEDDVADTIRPRLDAAHADSSKIIALQGVEFHDSESGEQLSRAFNLEHDLPALQRAIVQTPDCRLVIIDPLTAYLGKVDSHKNAELRGLLAPLSELAAKYNVAIVGVTHLTKALGGKAIYRALGSLAFVAASRAFHFVIADRKNPGRRFVLPVKMNLSPDDVGGLAYRMESASVPVIGSVGVVAWEANPVTERADDLLDAETNGRRGDGERLAEAMEFLRELLADGPVAVDQIEADAKKLKIGWRTLQRAKGKLLIKARKTGFGGGWTWVIPEHR